MVKISKDRCKYPIFYWMKGWFRLSTNRRHHCEILEPAQRQLVRDRASRVRNNDADIGRGGRLFNVHRDVGVEDVLPLNSCRR